VHVTAPDAVFVIAVIDLPPSLASVLAPELPGLADEIMAAIAAEVPAYARPLEGAFGRGLRAGVDEALRQFLEQIRDPAAGRETEVYRTLGRGEWREGRSLDALLAAYRVGARVAWRRLARAGTAAGVEPETMNLLAESIFAYIDELSAESVEGYAQAQALAAGERQRRRQRLLELLLTDRTAPAATRRRAAADAEWSLPARAAVVAVMGNAARLAGRMGPDALGGTVDDSACVVMPDPEGPGRAAILTAALADRRAAISPATTLDGLPDAFRWARAALELRDAGGSLVRVDDHLAALALHGDPALVARLRARRLAPLGDLPERTRARLAETLAAWLDERGNAVAVAARLHVHPQTVRYRLAQLRERFGETLEDADARFELMLALRSGDARPGRGATPGG
jgi:PucR C-terminal helix-turn-helix domain